ncbi:hypothetical protein YC2023_106398 [Brassica napus]
MRYRWFFGTVCLVFLFQYRTDRLVDDWLCFWGRAVSSSVVVAGYRILGSDRAAYVWKDAESVKLPTQSSDSVKSMVARVFGVIPVVSGGFWFSCSDDSQVEEDGDIVFARVPFFS